MNREIKFRAWDIENKIMFDVFGFDVNHVYPWQREGDKVPPTIPETTDCVLMQYTELCDKNKKEIYEGDIVYVSTFEPSRMRVSFIEGAFCLTNKDGEFVADIHFIYHAGQNNAVVIGNIFENPDLLGKNN